MSMTSEFTAELKIPKERIAVLIGKEGEIKAEIEEKTNTKLDIDSKEGDVFIKGSDGLNIYDAKEVVQAIARGFNPQISMQLLKGDYILEVISLKDFAGTKNSMQRLKGRIIGSEGKSRKTIEELTDTHISVYGKTIGIIGRPENVTYAKQAVVKLLSGSPHSGVFRALEKKRKVIKQSKFEFE